MRGLSLIDRPICILTAFDVWPLCCAYYKIMKSVPRLAS